MLRRSGLRRILRLDQTKEHTTTRGNSSSFTISVGFCAAITVVKNLALAVREACACSASTTIGESASESNSV